MNQMAREAAVSFDRAMILGINAHRVVEAAVDDLSAHILEDYRRAGFREVEWQYGFEEWQNAQIWQEMGSVCPMCFALDGQHFKIEWLLQNMHHNAPKYSMSHVNCACRLVPMNRTEELLDYSETVDVAPAEIPSTFKDQPLTLDEVPEDQRAPMGLPPEQNGFTDIQWQWDATRNEFVPLKTLADEGAMPEWVWNEKAQEFTQKGGGTA